MKTYKYKDTFANYIILQVDHTYSSTKVTRQPKFRDSFGKKRFYSQAKKIQRSMNKDNPSMLQVCVSLVPVHEVSRPIDCN